MKNERTIVESSFRNLSPCPIGGGHGSCPERGQEATTQLEQMFNAGKHCVLCVSVVISVIASVKAIVIVIYAILTDKRQGTSLALLASTICPACFPLPQRKNGHSDDICAAGFFLENGV